MDDKYTRYNASPKGKARDARYRISEKRRVSRLRYEAYGRPIQRAASAARDAQQELAEQGVTL